MCKVQAATSRFREAAIQAAAAVYYERKEEGRSKKKRIRASASMQPMLPIANRAPTEKVTRFGTERRNRIYCKQFRWGADKLYFITVAPFQF